jgi:hypothetical protein
MNRKSCYEENILKELLICDVFPGPNTEKTPASKYSSLSIEMKNNLF